jgi:hypothetical protein
VAIAERPAQRRDVNSEARFFDKGIGPDAGEQLLLAQHLAWLLHQRDQDIAGAATQSDGRVALQQLTSADKQTKRAERHNFIRCFVRLVGSHRSYRED